DAQFSPASSATRPLAAQTSASAALLADACEAPSIAGIPTVSRLSSCIAYRRSGSPTPKSNSSKLRNQDIGFISDERTNDIWSRWRRLLARAVWLQSNPSDAGAHRP